MVTEPGLMVLPLVFYKERLGGWGEGHIETGTMSDFDGRGVNDKIPGVMIVGWGNEGS